MNNIQPNVVPKEALKNFSAFRKFIFTKYNIEINKLDDVLPVLMIQADIAQSNEEKMQTLISEINIREKKFEEAVDKMKEFQKVENFYLSGGSITNANHEIKRIWKYKYFFPFMSVIALCITVLIFNITEKVSEYEIFQSNNSIEMNKTKNKETNLENRQRKKIIKGAFDK